MKQVLTEKKDQQIFNELSKKFALSERQQEQIVRYLELLIQENKKFNITAITSKAGVLKDHFYDSLMISQFVDFSKLTMIADVGTGGGFPGVPLAVLYPNITVHLIEVNSKKIEFLQLVADELGLDNILIHTDDWRTFLRKVNEPIDLFIARASLSVQELLRLFQPSLSYGTSQLAYWASKHWQPTDKQQSYLDRCESYHVGEKFRKVCFFKKV